MVQHGFRFIGILCFICLTFSSTSYAGKRAAQSKPSKSKRQKLPIEGLEVLCGPPLNKVFSFLDADDLQECDATNRSLRTLVRSWDEGRWKLRVKRIEKIMNKFGGFIPLNQNPDWKDSKVDESIAKVALTQELWVELMGNNPAYYKKPKYCPETYREIIARGTPVGMCPDFPLERVAAVSEGRNDSDNEFIAELNRIYRLAGMNVKFRRSTRAEYNWADTEGGTAPKLKEHADLPSNDPRFLGRFLPYKQISDKDPHDLTKPSPSGKIQPRSIADNEANSFGFRRSGVWEWAEDMDGLVRAIVGGAWNNLSKRAASDYRRSFWQGYRYDSIGPARLVKHSPKRN